MSLLSSPKPYAPAAPDIQRKLQEAQSRLRPLEASQGDLALDAELGNAAAREHLSAVTKQIETERAVIAKLRLAHAAGLARDQEAERAQRAALRKTQIAALRKHLEARDAAAETLSGAIAEAVKQFKLVVERSGKAGSIAPIGDRLPDGAISTFDQLRVLVAQEIYRHDGGDALSGNKRSFPGAVVVDINQQGNVAAIEPLAVHLRRNSAFILDAITGGAT